MSDEKRRPRAMGQLTADEPEQTTGQGLTIVGGQPPRRQRRKRSLQGVPVGVERVLYMAASDAAFRSALEQDRDTALADPSLQLRPSELAMLRAISAEQLSAAIASVDVRPQNVERRQFLRAVAVSTLTLAAGGAVSGAAGCGDEASPPDGQGWGVDAGVRDGPPPQADIWGIDAGVPPDLPPQDTWGMDAGTSPPDLPPQDTWAVDAGTDGAPPPDSGKQDK